MEEERNEEEQILMYQIVDAVSVILTIFKARAFGPLEQSLLPLVMQMAQAGSDPYHAKMAVFVLCDVVEQCVHAQAGGAHHAARYLPAINAALVAGAQSPDPGVRQPAFFGLGLIAQHAGAAVADGAVAQLAQLLQQYVGTAAVWQGEQVNAAENAVAAIGRVCEFRATTAGACCYAPRGLLLWSIAMATVPQLTPRARPPFPRSLSPRRRRQHALRRLARPPSAAARYAGVEVDGRAAVPARDGGDSCAARRRRAANG